MPIFEFEQEIEPSFLKCYHNNIKSKYVDLSGYDNVIKILSNLLKFSKLVKISQSTTQNVLKCYEKPFLPKYFDEALKLTSFNNLIFKRNGFYKIRIKAISDTLMIPIKDIYKDFDNYKLYYCKQPFYIIDNSPGSLFKYSFLATNELETIFNESVISHSELESSEESEELEDLSDTEEEQIILRDFQKEELELMLNNSKYYFSNPPRTGTSYVIAAYCRYNPDKKILILVSRTHQEEKLKHLIKNKNTTIVMYQRFNELQDKNFDVVICDECHNNYLYTFDVNNPIVKQSSKFKGVKLSGDIKTFFFSSTMPNCIDYNKFYEYTYEKALEDKFVVPVSINIPNKSLKSYLNETSTEHILIVCDNMTEFSKSSSNIIKILKEDTIKERDEKIMKFNTSARVLIAPTSILEGLDTTACDEIIIYKPSYKFTNIIQVCGRCLTPIKGKSKSLITIFDKTNLSEICQYFEHKQIYSEKYKLKRYFDNFTFNFISDFEFYCNKFSDIINNMEENFDRSKFDQNLINLFTKSDYSKQYMKQIIETKFDTNVDKYISLMCYNGNIQEIPKSLLKILNTKSENTPVENTYCINGFNYSTKFKPKITKQGSQTAKQQSRKMFYSIYGTTKLKDTDILCYNNRFYLWKYCKPIDDI